MPAEYHIFFAVRPTVYESARSAADSAMDFPSGAAETSIPALSDAPKRSADGWALVALRKALVPADVEASIQSIVAAGDAEQLSKSEYLAAIDQEAAE